MMVIYLPVKFQFDWTKHFRVNKNVDGQTDRRTDIGHINLIKPNSCDRDIIVTTSVQYYISHCESFISYLMKYFYPFGKKNYKKVIN